VTVLTPVLVQKKRKGQLICVLQLKVFLIKASRSSECACSSVTSRNPVLKTNSVPELAEPGLIELVCERCKNISTHNVYDLALVRICQISVFCKRDPEFWEHRLT
jgi:hypothetical protein